MLFRSIAIESTMLLPKTMSIPCRSSAVGSPVTITYSYSNLLAGSLPGGLTVAQLRAATEEAMALWSSFATEGARDTVQLNRGMPAELVVEAVNIVRSARTLRSLEAEMEPLPLSAARKLGLPEKWIDKIDQHNPARRQVLSIVRTVADELPR